MGLGESSGPGGIPVLDNPIGSGESHWVWTIPLDLDNPTGSGQSHWVWTVAVRCKRGVWLLSVVSVLWVSR